MELDSVTTVDIPLGTAQQQSTTFTLWGHLVSMKVAHLAPMCLFSFVLWFYHMQVGGCRCYFLAWDESCSWAHFFPDSSFSECIFIVCFVLEGKVEKIYMTICVPL